MKINKKFKLLSILISCFFFNYKTQANTNANANLFFDEKIVILLETIKKQDIKKSKLIIEEGVDLNIIGKEGITPLFWLIMQKELNAIEISLKLGANPNFPVMIKRNREGYKPAQILSILAGDCTNEIFEILLKYGANPNSIDETTG